ncbi:MAG: hypothetical protein WAV20_24080 [Blastocatellia bacterium]
MEKKLATHIFALILSLVAAGSASADIKMKTKNTSAGSSNEGTIYIKGARQRSSQSYGSFEMVTLTQCDLKRTVQINDKARTFMVTPMVTASSTTTPAEKPPATPSQPTTTRRGGVVTYDTSINDTGERKKIFGFTARHIKTSLNVESTPEACNPARFRLETDGWYIDLDFSFNCDSDGTPAASIPHGARPDCKDEVRFKKSGTGKLGYPVIVTTTIYLDGGQISTSSTEVVELTTTPLEASLFDVPSGYTEVKDYQALMGMPPVQTIPGGPPATQTPAETMVTPATTKRPGTVRVGVVWIANKTDRSPSVDMLRSRLIGGIIESDIDAVPLDSRTPADIEAEAKRKACDYILYTDITLLKASGKVGGLLGRATGVGGLKERVESRLDFRLFPVGSSTPQLTSAATAKEDGSEDASLTTAAGQEAKAVVAEVRKRK